MPIAQVVPLLLSILTGSLFALLTWGFLGRRSHRLDSSLMTVHDEMLFGLLALAAFTLGAFLIYVLLR